MLGEPTGGLLSLLLFAGLLGLAALAIVLAVSIAVAAHRLLLFLVMIPLRLAGWLLGVGLSAVGLLFKSVLMVGIVALVIVVGLLPLVPLLLVGVLILYLVRAARKRPSHAGA